MIIEATIFIPLLIARYYGFINWLVVILIFCLYYWLPKYVVLDCFVERFYPTILTRHKDPVKKTVRLTFDDVPYDHHHHYIKIIELLDRYHMKGTFFVISDFVDDKNKRHLVNAVKNGHQLGNHGKTNSIHATKSTEELSNEIDSCDKVIREIYKEAVVDLPKLMVYRPGCGLFTNSMLKLVESKGYRLALGSVYPNDPLVRWSLVNYMYLIKHIENGDIIILHDREWTMSLLKMLLPWLTSNGYISDTLESCIR